tara:strand:- start:2465 stop:2890 length:426 start_codon:yes stop_codon:yes gene_type:complete
MKKLLSIILFTLPTLLLAQNHYKLLDIQIIQSDSIVYQGGCDSEVNVGALFVELIEQSSTTRFNIISQPDSLGFMQLTSFSDGNKPELNWFFNVDNLVEQNDKGATIEVDGKLKQLYSIQFESYAPGATNNIKYAYIGYKQ